MTATLTNAESARLLELEEQIERGLGTFMKVGEALLEIRDTRLYRLSYSSFEDYCRGEWEMGRQKAYLIIGAFEATRNLSSDVTNGDTATPVPKNESQPRTRRTSEQIAIANLKEKPQLFLPKNERQARPLTQLKSAEQQREAWHLAVEMAEGQPSAYWVQEAVDQILEGENGNAGPTEQTVSPVEPAQAGEADSETLLALKNAWRACNEEDRAIFAQWVTDERDRLLNERVTPLVPKLGRAGH